MGRLPNAAKMGAQVTGKQISEDLHGQIVRDELRPGEAISETRIADSYALSRTPVRETLWRPGEDGSLRVVPQVGTFVVPINIPALFLPSMTASSSARR